MSDIRPFAGYRPRPDLVSKIASPPYDVLNSEEARILAGDNELSFLHVIKPEIDFDSSVDPHSDEVYQKGRENLENLIENGQMIHDREPCLYIYQQQMGDHVQTGLIAGASVEEYRKDLIKKHEHTRPDKENDRAHHIEVLGANTGPVFLTYHADEKINGIIENEIKKDPAYNFTCENNVRHTLWVIKEKTTIEELVNAFKAVSCLYVADGHHRSAAASRVYDKRKAANPDHNGSESYNYFLTVVFPDDQMQIMDYNRVVMDLNGLDEETFLEKVKEKFDLAPTNGPKPDNPNTFGMLLNKKWYRMTAKEGAFPKDDPVKSLDVAILQDNLLDPVLGIKDPRKDKRIDFVGGIRGLAELEKRCNTDAAVAFALHPTRMDQLMAIADAGEVMPPKSTWFEPKLRSGIVVKKLD